MDTEIEDVVTDETNTTGKDKVETPAPKEKVFTQKELDKIVIDRVNREKLTFKSEKESIESEKLSLKEVNEKFEAKLKELIAPELENVDENYRELLEKLPLLEQVEFINKLNSKSNSNPDRKFIPKTNKSNTDDKGVVVGVEPVQRYF